MDDSVIICHAIIDVKETNLNEKHITCKTQSFYILLAFLLITMAITKTFITISQHEKLKQIYVDNIN